MLTILAWAVGIGIAILAFMFAGASLGALIGNTVVALRKLRRN